MQKLIICIAAIFVATTAAQDVDKVSVQVYYESLCPDSIKFFTMELYPTLQKGSFDKYIELELLPYGKSDQDYLNGWHFTCHHGPNECYGNMVQACALNLLPKSNGQPGNSAVAYINCLMGKVDRLGQPFVYPTRECAAQTNIGMGDQIEQCANSTEGQKHLSDVGNLTRNLKPALTSVPTIIFDKHFDKEDQQNALTSFRKTLCRKIRDRSQIPECADSGASSVTIVGSMVFVATALMFSV